MKDCLISDTAPHIEAMRISMLREAGFTRRAGRALSLSRSVALLSLAAVRKANPGLTESEVGLRFVELHYGKDLAERLRAYLHGRQV